MRTDAILVNTFVVYKSTAVYMIYVEFCKEMQNPSTVTVDRHKFRILKIQDG